MKKTVLNVSERKTVDVELSVGESNIVVAEWQANLAGARRSRSLGAIEADLDTLSNAKLLRILKRMIAERLLSDPKMLRRLGEAIDGDEPVV